MLEVMGMMNIRLGPGNMMTSGSRSDAFNESHVSNHERRLNELNYRVREVNLPQMECINIIKQIKTKASNRDKLKHFTMNSRAEEHDDLRSHEGSGDETESEDGEDDVEHGDETESEDGEEDEHEQEEEVRQEHQQTHG
ncbi:histone acetyltransferase GCN5-like [Hordeum vulgare subsp. vulgare]|uniref:histone acetyltransferase GCN5-like n=1 Tax=Hordeum vulgare subsp. vulgare TaxID=112509 RepID=UPI00162B4453|nr:histone acetyltransferase GCN5-like [Hordeum vulgare subsp. vulgare]